MKSVRSQRGAALILVLWMVVALSLVVLAGARSARLYTQRVSLELERMRAETLLDGAIEVVANRMIVDRALGGSYRSLLLGLGGGDVTVESVPATGLIDVNVASPELLDAFLRRIGGLTVDEAIVMRARLKDFVDTDNEPSGVGGAESGEYAAAGSPARPANTLISDVSELRSVLGMTPELYDIISPYLGINGGQKIDIDAAPPDLIDALSGQAGLGAQYHATPPEQKGGLTQSELMGQLFTSSKGMAGGQTMRLKAVVQTQDQRRWERLVWLDLATRQDALTPWTTRSIEPLHRSRAGVE